MTLVSGARSYVDPIWSIRDGLFHPIDWSEAPRSALASDIVDALGRCPVHNASLLLRGSVLEQVEPHPGADIDLVVLTDDRRQVTLDLSALSVFGRPIDAPVVERGSKHPDTVFLTLAHTRALHVGGEPHLPRPVAVTRQLMVDHWLKYAPFGLPGTLTSQGLRRVAEVKQIVRAIGLVHALRGHRFSRDLPTCLEWATEESTQLGADAQALFETLQVEPSPPYEVRRLQAWLRLHFSERLEGWAGAS